MIILGFYGVYFLLALPLVRLRARTLAIIAAAFALVSPQLAFALTSLLTPSVQESINAYDPLYRLSEVGGLDLLLTGFYPALTWMSFVIAGMALGRLDLSSGTVRRRLAALGAAPHRDRVRHVLAAGRQGRVAEHGGRRVVVPRLRFDAPSTAGRCRSTADRSPTGRRRCS